MKRARNVTFQLIDIDTFVHDNNESMIRLFGRDENKKGVCVYVRGFLPYFYCNVPTTRNIMHTDDYFTQVLKKSIRWRQTPAPDIRLKTVKRKDIMNYSPTPKNYFHISTANIMFLNQIMYGIQQNHAIHGSGKIFENHIPHPLRFMIDTSIEGACWISIMEPMIVSADGAFYKVNPVVDTYVIDSCDCTTLQAIPPTTKSDIADLVILSYDIECKGRPGIFPSADQDPVIQIGNVIADKNGQPLHKIIFTLHSCAPITGVTVISCDDEAEMLIAWRDMIIQHDPDIFTGYNIVNFDFPYLFKRAETLKVIMPFSTFSRVPGYACSAKSHLFQSQQSGARETFEFDIPGRFVMDMYQFIQTNPNYKLRSMSLNSVALHFLGDQKEDVHFSQIAKLQEKDAESRRLLAVYCLKDCDLPLRLMQRLMVLPQLVEMSRVTGVPLTYLMTKGQQIKVMSQICRYALKEEIIIPKISHYHGNDDEDDDADYEGATVIEPKIGFYDVPIATLDFASLYPSIMMAHNLCYTTFVPPWDVKRVQDEIGADNLTTTPNNDTFVKSNVYNGLLPQILRELIMARKKAKADMANAKGNDMMHAILDARQLSIKVSANSVYGFTGASRGKLPLKNIAASVTAFGRQMIDATKTYVENNYPGAYVVYGDTDSVMVRFRNDSSMTVAEAMTLGKEAADRISKELFISPIKLEFEKVYYPYMLFAKKKYAAMYWSKSIEKPDKMDMKGVETVRRDACLLISRSMKSVFDHLLEHRSITGAIRVVHDAISALNQNKVDMADLVVSKPLKSMKNEKLPHVQVALKMEARKSKKVPVLGERVPYVIVKGIMKSLKNENAEDPEYALEKGLQIDTDHYLDLLRQSFDRVFVIVYQNDKSKINAALYEGPHMTTIAAAHRNKTADNKTGMEKFVKKVDSCIGCGVAVTYNHHPSKAAAGLCTSCESHRVAISIKVINEQREAESAYHALWSQCQRCTKNRHSPIDCNSRECVIYYRRTQARITCGAINEKATTLHLMDQWDMEDMF
jgi:DNA polymerase delta subunit 1